MSALRLGLQRKASDPLWRLVLCELDIAQREMSRKIGDGREVLMCVVRDEWVKVRGARY